MTSYASTYVYMFLLVGFFLPLKSSAALAMLRYCQPDSTAYFVIGKLVPAVMKLEVVPDGPQRLLFEKDKFVRQIVSSLAVLTTFGAVFPPLTVIILIAVFIRTYHLQWCVGDILLRAEERGYNVYKDNLNLETHGLAQSLVHSMWLLVPLSCLFYALFVFDTYADQAGWRASLWAVCLMAGMPLLLWGYVKAYYHVFPQHRNAVHPVITQLIQKADHTVDGEIAVVTVTSLETAKKRVSRRPANKRTSCADSPLHELRSRSTTCRPSAPAQALVSDREQARPAMCCPVRIPVLVLRAGDTPWDMGATGFSQWTWRRRWETWCCERWSV